MVISTIFGFVFSLILMGAGVLNKKADIDYVDKKDTDIKATIETYKADHKSEHAILYDDIKHIRSGVDDINKFLREKR